MKILQINAVYPERSTGVICSEITKRAAEKGHSTLNLYGFRDTVKADNALAISFPLLIKVNGFIARLSGYNAHASYFETNKAIRAIKKYKPDVVILHNLHSNYINIRMILSYLGKKDIPTVAFLLDCWNFTGKCVHYTDIGCDKWKTGCHDCPILKDGIPSWLFDKTPQMWNEKKRLFNGIKKLGVAGISEWITNEARKGFFESHVKFKRTYLWIDTEIFTKKAIDRETLCEMYGIPKDKFTVICVSAGWGVNSQRYHDLQKIIAADKDNYYFVVGDVPKETAARENVKYLGYFRDAEKLASLYNLADVYLHLSHEDSFGKVIVEAMSCGTPAIVYDSTAYPELVKEDCGVICKTGDINAIKNAIELVKSKGKEYYSENCINRVKNNFSKNDNIDKLLDFCVEVIE